MIGLVLAGTAGWWVGKTMHEVVLPRCRDLRMIVPAVARGWAVVYGADLRDGRIGVLKPRDGMLVLKVHAGWGKRPEDCPDGCCVHVPAKPIPPHYADLDVDTWRPHPGGLHAYPSSEKDGALLYSVGWRSLVPGGPMYAPADDIPDPGRAAVRHWITQEEADRLEAETLVVNMPPDGHEQLMQSVRRWVEDRGLT